MLVLCWLLVIANTTGFGTMLLGWWVVPLVAFGGTAWAPKGTRPLGSVPLGCLGGWIALLARSGQADGFPELTRMLSEILSVPAGALMAGTLGFALVLAWGGALAGWALRPGKRKGS